MQTGTASTVAGTALTEANTAAREQQTTYDDLANPYRLSTLASDTKHADWQAMVWDGVLSKKAVAEMGLTDAQTTALNAKVD